LALDGEFLWVAAASVGERYPNHDLLLFHLPSRHWVGGARVGGSSVSLALGGGKLWVGVPHYGSFHIEVFEKQSFLAIPREKWLPEKVDPADLAQTLAKLTPHQQAVCHFFWNEPDAAISLLTKQSEDSQDAESLFLLANLARETEAKNQFVKRVLADFPESVFARYFLQQSPQFSSK
jgi:hypothetical protein